MKKHGLIWGIVLLGIGGLLAAPFTGNTASMMTKSPNTSRFTHTSSSNSSSSKKLLNPPPTSSKAKGTAHGSTMQRRPISRPVPLPDLVVDKLWVDTKGILCVKLKNQGKGPIPKKAFSRSTVTFEAGGKIHRLYLTTMDKKAALIASGGSAVYNTGQKVSNLKITVTVDANNAIRERNEKNNKKSITPHVSATALTHRTQSASSAARGTQTAARRSVIASFVRGKVETQGKKLYLGFDKPVRRVEIYYHGKRVDRGELRGKRRYDITAYARRYPAGTLTFRYYTGGSQKPAELKERMSRFPVTRMATVSPKGTFRKPASALMARKRTVPGKPSSAIHAKKVTTLQPAVAGKISPSGERVALRKEEEKKGNASPEGMQPLLLENRFLRVTHPDPKAGEKVYAGWDYRSIRWEWVEGAPDLDGLKIGIYLWRDGREVSCLGRVPASHTSFMWPHHQTASLQPGRHYQIRLVVSRDGGRHGIHTMSEDFEVARPTLSLYLSGNNIAWDIDAPPGLRGRNQTITLSYQLNGETTWHEIGTAYLLDERYPWTPPAVTETRSVKIRARWRHQAAASTDYYTTTEVVSIPYVLTPSTPETQLNPNAQPLYGTVTLSSDFSPDPLELGYIKRGGHVDVSSYFGRPAYTTAVPALAVDLQYPSGTPDNGRLPALTFHATTRTDLLIRTPDGRYITDEVVENPREGRYLLWGVSDIEEMGGPTYALYVSRTGRGTTCLIFPGSYAYKYYHRYTPGGPPWREHISLVASNCSLTRYCAGWEGCSGGQLTFGWVGPARQLTLSYTGPHTSLLVMTPSGRFFCGHSVTLNHPEEGVYNVWIGLESSDDISAGEFVITPTFDED